ncbi:MAG: recombinase family protein [Oscillospiraceae bacterium]|nr:recombinase family protein [Oscillospiraceae bacterium]
MPPEVTKIVFAPAPARRIRVAAYARVSSGKDAMLHSLSAQVSQYSQMIQSNPGWEYAGVYADEAKTGTKSDSREEFNRLLEDCRSGLVEMIITKSISRFARNTVTLLSVIRELKALGVDVFFEEQKLHTMSADGELMLTVLGSYAQEESLSASENQKWRIRKNFSEGKPWDATILGYRVKDGEYVIEEGEAAIVRRIYEMYLEGRGMQAICNTLNAEGVKTRFSRSWHISTVRHILSNPTYTGNLILQKTFRADHLTKKRLKNVGQLPKIEVTEAHEAIISQETFDRVQAIRQTRAERLKTKEKDYTARYPFSGLITCACCGAHYRRKVTHTGPVWMCATYNKLGRKGCQSKAIPETVLQTLLPSVEGVEQIRAENGNCVVIRFKDGNETRLKWNDRSRAESWTPEMKEQARERAKRQHAAHTTD